MVYFKYAPITSIDVERWFSFYKNMPTNNCRAFKFDNKLNLHIYSTKPLFIIGEEEDNKI